MLNQRVIYDLWSLCDFIKVWYKDRVWELYTENNNKSINNNMKFLHVQFFKIRLFLNQEYIYIYIYTHSWEKHMSLLTSDISFLFLFNKCPPSNLKKQNLFIIKKKKAKEKEKVTIYVIIPGGKPNHKIYCNKQIHKKTRGTYHFHTLKVIK